MKVAPRQIDSFLSAIPTDINAALFHGNDLGLISERAGQVAHQISHDLDDVFSVTRLDGDQVASDPAIISDSAKAIAMTADRRLVWVRGKGSEMLAGCKNAFAQTIESAFIIIEASDAVIIVENSRIVTDSSGFMSTPQNVVLHYFSSLPTS